MDGGLVNSAALMTPCPQFAAAADWFRQHPSIYVGVHITLNSEWESYRWRPLSTADPASGLLDTAGFLPRTVDELNGKATASTVLTEARAQVERFRRSGLTTSHLDAHMFAIRRLFPIEYLGLARECKVPALATARDVERAHASGALVFDHIAITPNEGNPADRIDILKALFEGLPEGLSCVLLHPACDTPELRAIVPKWRYRVADWIAFRDARLQAHVRSLGIQAITYRELAAALAPETAETG
jgi:predicted glycoside hydrolase/deacetylase ChbG (UPF0249 family)